MRGRSIAVFAAVSLLAGCDFRFPNIDLSTRKPIPVDPETDKILTEWQRRRATTKSVYGEFSVEIDEQAFKTRRKLSGVLRYRHSDVARLDIRKESVDIYTKNNEWHSYLLKDRIASIRERPESSLLPFLQATQFAWFIPTDKTTLQKHGAIRKVDEDKTKVVLQVRRSGQPQDSWFDSMIIHLRKPDLLPVKMIVDENEDTKRTWEFTEMHENVDFNDSDFVPPKLNESWRVDRVRLAKTIPENKPVRKDDSRPQSTTP